MNKEPTTEDFLVAHEDDKPDYEELEGEDYEDEWLWAQEVCNPNIGNVTVF